MAATERTTKEVVGDAQLHLRELVDAHIQLAKAEMAEAQKQATAAIGPFVVAGVLAVFILGFFGVTAAKVLELWLVEWAAWLIVSGALTLVAAIAVLAGVRAAQRMDASPTATKQSIAETVAWAKDLSGRNR